MGALWWISLKQLRFVVEQLHQHQHWDFAILSLIIGFGLNRINRICFGPHVIIYRFG